MVTINQAAELEQLLSESVDHARERERTEFDRIAGSRAASVVLFGARKLGQLVLAGLRQSGAAPCAFCDDNPALWGQSIEGVPVFSPADAARRFGDSAVFVIAVWGRGSRDPMSGREGQLRDLGCRRVVSFGPLFWKYAEVFLPRIPALDLPHKVLDQSASVRQAFTVLADERSRREFLLQLRWRLHFDFDVLPDPVAAPIYFPSELVALRDDEVFVDIGAFDGDTLRDFLTRSESRFRGIIAFEPDPVSLGRLRQTVAGLSEEIRNRIRVVPAATGAQRGTVRFSAKGELGSATGTGDCEVPVVTLDETLDGQSPTYIKMDVEAAELDTLSGARQIIHRHAPVLAACAYHVLDHLWKLPGLMHALNPEYRIFLRPHIQMVEDLVCYAVPLQRSRL